MNVKRILKVFGWASDGPSGRQLSRVRAIPPPSAGDLPRILLYREHPHSSSCSNGHPPSGAHSRHMAHGRITAPQVGRCPTLWAGITVSLPRCRHTSQTDASGDCSRNELSSRAFEKIGCRISGLSRISVMIKISPQKRVGPVGPMVSVAEVLRSDSQSVPEPVT